MSTHELLQRVCVFGHMPTHVPREQSGVVPPQGILQPPQSAGSVSVSTHTPLQSFPPFGQAHTLLPQTWPPVQTTPHMPQLLLSPFRFTQPAPHWVSAFGHVAMPQTPSWHTCMAPHGMLQPPQFCAFDCVSTQMPLHKLWPTGHAHALLTQACPPVHAIPQPPQLAESLLVSTQPPLQLVSGAQLVVHTPEEHT